MNPASKYYPNTSAIANVTEHLAAIAAFAKRNRIEILKADVYVAYVQILPSTGFSGRMVSMHDYVTTKHVVDYLQLMIDLHC